ncbi:LPXTG cell wall anchor domain-containing protein [Glycomyces tenuis]|uniref:LPXTG cell wall anchor domain-containing protein n=1 Tax=Glycomyces tenuis TaxID=58116 RepID=UPI00040F83FC|nr:LPXTG cell wall anchor domain-containing protein [Glycomyces tenuis]
MRTFYPRAVLISAAALLPLAAPALAHAAELPAEPVLMHLKDHPELPLAWTGERAELAAEGDAWSFTPVEAFQDLGTHLIVHDETGQCLDAGPIPDGAETATVELADCADATPWGVVYNDVPAHQDYRFTTPEGHYLGIERGSQAAAGTEVLVVAVPSSVHAQEWQFADVPEQTPSTPPPAEETTAAPAAEPKLPQTGAGVAALSGAGVVAVAAGAAMVLWLRRRTLRDQW